MVQACKRYCRELEGELTESRGQQRTLAGRLQSCSTSRCLLPKGDSSENGGAELNLPGVQTLRLLKTQVHALKRRQEPYLIGKTTSPVLEMACGSSDAPQGEVPSVE